MGAIINLNSIQILRTQLHIVLTWKIIDKLEPITDTTTTCSIVLSWKLMLKNLNRTVFVEVDLSPSKATSLSDRGMADT